MGGSVVVGWVYHGRYDGVGTDVLDGDAIEYCYCHHSYDGYWIQVCSSISRQIMSSVDCLIHDTYGFMTRLGTRVERMTQSLIDFGLSIINGGFTTFLSVSVMVFSTSEMFKIFFRMTTIVIGLGLATGFLFVPAVLSWFGPKSLREVKSSSSGADVEMQQKAIEDVCVNSCPMPATPVQDIGSSPRPLLTLQEVSSEKQIAY